MPDKKNDKRAVSGDFTDLLNTIYHDTREAFKRLFGLGVVGTFAWIMFDDPEGRKLIKRFGSLIGHGADWSKAKAQKFALLAAQWTETQYHKLVQSVIMAVVAVVSIGIAALFVSAWVPWMWVRALAIVASCGVIFFWLHVEWARWFPLIIKLGVAAGFIEQGASADFSKLGKLPAFVFGGAKRGIETGLGWIGSVWRWVGQTIVWYCVGAMYVILVPLHQTPALLVAALPTIAIFVIVPLVWNWKDRGAHISWILWASVLLLWAIIPMAVVSEIYRWFQTGQWLSLPGQEGTLVARVALVLFANALGFLAWYIVHKSRPKSEVTGTVLPGMLYRAPSPWPRRVFWGSVAIVFFAILIFKLGFANRVNNVVVNDGYTAVNAVTAGKFYPNPQDNETNFVKRPYRPIAQRDLGNGWTEFEIQAALGHCQLPVMLKFGQRLEGVVTDSTYEVSFGPQGVEMFNRPTAVATTSGFIQGRQYLAREINPLWPQYLAMPEKPIGILQVREGRAGIPRALPGPHWNLTSYTPMDQEVFLSLGLPDFGNRASYQISGTYKIKLKLWAKPA